MKSSKEEHFEQQLEESPPEKWEIRRLPDGLSFRKAYRDDSIIANPRHKKKNTENKPKPRLALP